MHYVNKQTCAKECLAKAVPTHVLLTCGVVHHIVVLEVPAIRQLPQLLAEACVLPATPQPQAAALNPSAMHPRWPMMALQMEVYQIRHVLAMSRAHQLLASITSCCCQAQATTPATSRLYMQQIVHR